MDKFSLKDLVKEDIETVAPKSTLWEPLTVEEKKEPVQEFSAKTSRIGSLSSLNEDLKETKTEVKSGWTPLVQKVEEPPKQVFTSKKPPSGFKGLKESIKVEISPALKTSIYERIELPPVVEYKKTAEEERDELVQSFTEQIKVEEQNRVSEPVTRNEPVEEPVAEEATTIEPVVEEEPKEKTLIDKASEFITKELKTEENSFQQPDVPPTAQNFKEVTRKMKFLEEWIAKVSMAGPGSGAVNLKDLDDVDYTSVRNATNNQVLTFNASSNLWIAKSATAGGGISLTDLSVTLDIPNGNGTLAYDNNTGIFNFVPANLAVKANVADLTTANVIELGNLYFTNARSVAALTAGSNITIESNGRISASVNIPAQLQSDWNQTDSSNVEYIKNKPNLSNLEIAANVLAVTHEPMGFEERTDSNISFNDATRTFTITPAASSYNVWVSGTRYTINNTRTVALPNTTGLYYIYYSNTGTLSYKTTFYDWPNEAPTAYVYWNSNVGDAPFIADERHGIVLDWQTHEYLHRTRGAAIANGFDATNYIVGGDGSSDTHLQLDIANGTFFDEDLQVDVVSTNTPTADTWEQDLTGPAKIPMFYLNGSGAWVIDAPTDFPVKQGTLPKYNLYSGGVWTTPDIDNNKFGVTFIIATNNINYPVIGIIGQDSHANQGDAEAVEFSDLNLTGFPVVEMRPLYKLVYDCKNSYTNSINARLVSIWDQRSFESTTSAIATYTDHGALSGLLDDDHTQYLLRTDANSVVYSNVISIGYATNTQLTSYATTTNVALKANIVDLTTANVTEVTNQYFTNARVVSAVSTNTLGNISTGNIVVSGTYDGISITGDRGNMLIGNNTRNGVIRYALNSAQSIYAGMQIQRNGSEAWFSGVNTTENFVIRANSSTDILTINSNGTITVTGSINGYAANTQLAVYATNAQLALYATNSQLTSYATTTNVELKANIVDLTTANVAEVTNLYFTNARSYANVITLGYAKTANLTTANVTEVTNLYFTNARAIAAVTNTTLSNITIGGTANVTYQPATTVGAAITVVAANTVGGAGYADFVKITNASGGATNTNKTIRLNGTGTIEIVNSTYSAVTLALTDSGNLTTAGTISAGAYTAGQVIKDTMLDNSQFSVLATTVATSTSDTDFISYSYTPVSSSSYLIIHVHVGNYNAGESAGTGTDSYISRIKVDGSEITYSRQYTRDSYTFRTGVLFPLTGRYTNSSTSAKSITVGVRRDSADDSISLVNSSTALWMRITEVAR